ncbi:hypothetical protein D3C87_41590 [compost metagenome]
MTNGEIINHYYKNAVKGLNEIILEDKDLWYSHIINLPQNLQATYTIVVFHEQVFNGGLHQYFFNSYGQFAYLTVEHLRSIKAFKSAAILDSAITLVNIEKMGLDEFRTKIFERELSQIIDFDDDLCDALTELDDEYYDLDEDLEQLLTDYLQRD